ncbi:Hypothetical Protein FCC1311_060272 [Hondaea fermentalgiana]|uniref:Uncharacterized protein n=1 Tax=Hondaea fermentalgiana TaxID=2315210 RepID=A0A2R5GG01_9STRA|nr:Hypothetical Protein FCC1311_060272 [Hondaea fermentalgiana]|eukprot:GBG29807.1 Hypothetical Protein FCC1311_060272 [Hondaea fermentalgiana]
MGPKQTPNTMQQNGWPSMEYCFPIDATTSNIVKLPDFLSEHVYAGAQPTGEPEHPNRYAYHMTIPGWCLSPNPSCLVEQAENEANNPGARMVFRVFTFLMRLIETDMYVSESGADGAAPAPRQPGDGVRLFVEYLVDDDGEDLDAGGATPGEEKYRDTQLIECIGIRFTLVVFGAQYEMSDALKKHFVALGKKKNAKKADFKPPEAVRAHEQIRSWATFKAHASVYAEAEDDGEDLEPTYESPLYVDDLFSIETASSVAERRTTRRVHAAQRGQACGIPVLCYEIKKRLANRVAMLYSILPRTLNFRHLDEHERRCVDGALCIMRDPGCLEARVLLQNRDLARMKRNDIRDLRLLLKHRMQALDGIADRPTRNRALLQLRRNAVHMHQRVFNGSAAISKPSAKIAAYAQTIETWTTPLEERTVLDRVLSTFANMIAEDFLDLESAIGVSTTHSLVHMALVSAFNAHYYKLGVLHLNLLFLGKGAAGKSFILDTVESLLIPGVSNKVTNITEKAMATGEDFNDHTSLYHEMPASLIVAENRQTGVETGNSILKDALTSGMVKTQTIFITEDGLREQREFESERCGVMIAATNEREDKMSHSMHSRFICVPVNEFERTGHTVADKKKGSMNLHSGNNPRVNRAQKERFASRVRRRLLMVHMVERLIASGVIDGPDMTVAKVGVQASMGYIKSTVIPDLETGPRDYDFIILYARTLTLMHACERYANDAESDGYGLAPTFENLLFPPGGHGITRYMVCTEEIAVFALSVFFKQLIRYNTMCVMELLLFAFRDRMQRDEGTGALIEDDGYYSTQPIFYKVYDIYNLAERSQRDRVSTAEIMSRENIIVAWRALSHSVKGPDGAVAASWSEQHSVVRFNKSYVDKYFQLRNENEFVLSTDVLAIFKDVVEKGFCHVKHRTKEHAIIDFPLVRNRPFILSTMDIKKGNRKAWLRVKDVHFDLRNLQPVEGQSVSLRDQDGGAFYDAGVIRESLGERVRYNMGVIEVHDDLEDIIFNRREIEARADLEMPEDEILRLEPRGDGEDSDVDPDEAHDEHDEDDSDSAAPSVVCPGFEFQSSHRFLSEIHTKPGTRVLYGGPTRSKQYPSAMKATHDKVYRENIIHKAHKRRRVR